LQGCQQPGNIQAAHVGQLKRLLRGPPQGKIVVAARAGNARLAGKKA
jgi:hypothetical protein